MRRSIALLAVLLFFASAPSADDAIPPDTVVAVKHATVYVRVQGPDWKATGSGFVVAVEKDSVLIATNYHVVAHPDYEKKPRQTPADFVKSLKVPAVTAVFDGGTKTELSAKAEVIAADVANDLAILRVAGLKDPPKPIEYANPPKLTETMSVYTFGFPFGQALATGKGAPAITVGKGSVSSLRLDDDGELAVVQIDGALNPGNSGGPVVDTKGRLVGVAVATIKGGQNIGFAVPSAELGKLMKGRIDGFHFTATKGADGKLVVKAEVGVLDPSVAVRGVTLHYLVVPPKGAKPKAGETIEKQPGAKWAALKVVNGVATGELPVDVAEGDLYVQAVPEGGVGATGTSKIENFSLVAPKGAGAVVLGPAGSVPAGSGAGEVPPPAGWKEYTAPTKTYMVWIPEKAKTSEKEEMIGKPPQRLRINTLVVEAPGGVKYLVEQVIITPPPRPGAVDRDALMAILRDVAIGDTPGARVTREIDAKMGRFPGKEYMIERGASATRARTFVIGSSLYLLRSVGTKAQVDAADSTLFLESCRLQVPNRPPVVPPGGGIAIAPGAMAGGQPNDPEFKDVAPAGGMLVGLEVGMGKLGPNLAPRSMRAVFLTGDKESYGEWRGTKVDANTEKVRLVAKPGYAVGAINARTTPFIFGMSVTFMKVVNGKLDPKDSYDSEWVGVKEGLGQGPVTVGGKGEPALGFIGKTNPLTVTGVGLLYTDLAKKEPDPGPGPGVVVGPPKANTPSVIVGGKNDPEFKELAPAGAALVGLEVGLGKNGPNAVVKAVRPIFRNGNKESFGEWRGPIDAANVTEKVKVVAKPGFAVGGLSVRTGAGIFGLSLTFMKLTDGKLDPKDTYESDWTGSEIGLGPLKVGGTGDLPVGFIGRSNANTISGLGLSFGEIAKKDPGVVAPPMPPMPPIGPVPAKPVRPEGRGPRIQGGGGNPEFRDHAPAGGYLVGFELGMGKFVNRPVVKALRPIYRVGEKDSMGEQFGTELKDVVKVVAKPGYAVGTVTVKTSLNIDGMTITFMKVVDGKLDPKDSYDSEWVAGTSGFPAVKLGGGDGTPVVGVLVKASAKDAVGLGLIYTDTNKPGLDGPWPAGKPSNIAGGGHDPDFREAGPDGTLLVGLEVGVGRFFDNPVIKSARPIYRAGEKETEGDWYGPTNAEIVKEVVKVVAKPGYAIGAISVKTGLGMDGMSITFMKVVNGQLDPKDSYESDWIGGMGGGGPVKVGDGTPVIGLIGKSRADTLSGLGLLHPADKK